MNNLESMNCLQAEVSHQDAETLPREGKSAFWPRGSPWFYPRVHIRAKITHQRVVAILPCHSWLGMKGEDTGDFLVEREVLGGSRHTALSLGQQTHSVHPLLSDYIKSKRRSHGRGLEKRPQASQTRGMETRGKVRRQEHRDSRLQVTDTGVLM